MSAKNDIYDLWLKTYREKQTDRNLFIEETEQDLLDGLEEVVRWKEGLSPALEGLASAFRIRIMMRKWWQQAGSVIDSLPFGDTDYDLRRQSVWDQQIRLNILMRKMEQSFSKGLEELAPLYKDASPILHCCARLSRTIALLREQWQDTETEISFIVKDPLNPEHHKQMQRMLARYD